MKKTLVLLTAVLATTLGGNNTFAQDIDEELVGVYRWFNDKDKNYVTVADGEFQEGQLLNWYWKDKTLLFFAYRNPGPDRVAIYSWFNPVTKDQISLAEDEFSDNEMLKMGYAQKRFQYYAATRRAPNLVAVYRWHKGKDWVVIPEEGDTDAYIKKKYQHKTFQYFGIVRSVDAPIYNQL